MHVRLMYSFPNPEFLFWWYQTLHMSNLKPFVKIVKQIKWYEMRLSKVPQQRVQKDFKIIWKGTNKHVVELSVDDFNPDSTY